MGNYASQADLKGRYQDDLAVAELTLDETTGVPDTGVLDEVIDGAEGEVNSYLGSRYTVPVDVSLDAGVAAVLKTNTLNLACIALELRTGDLTPDRETLWNKTIELLEKYRDGEIVLPTAIVLEATTARSDIGRYGTAGTDTDSKRLWTRETQGQL